MLCPYNLAHTVEQNVCAARIDNASQPLRLPAGEMGERYPAVFSMASDSITKRGVSTLSLPQVIFSLGTAPE